MPMMSIEKGDKAPEGYQPDIASEMVYDDQVEALAPSSQWHPYFAGGSNRRHFLRVDDTGGQHFVEHAILERYEAYGPGYHIQCDSAFDAFYSADRRIDGN